MAKVGAEVERYSRACNTTKYSGLKAYYEQEWEKLLMTYMAFEWAIHPKNPDKAHWL